MYRRIVQQLYQATGWPPLAPLLVPGRRDRPRSRGCPHPWASPRCDAVLIHPGGIVDRGRVLRVARSLLDAGWKVAFFGKLLPRESTANVEFGEALGCPVFYFPDAHAFLPRGEVRLPSLNWPLMVQYLRAAMWPYVRALQPRVIHTFGVAAIGLGHDFRDRLRAEGHRVGWCHDFLEHTAGHAFLDSRVAAGVDDEEWRRVVVAFEAAHARHSDCALTVSAALAAALVEDYGLQHTPRVLLNAPRLCDFDADHHPTVRQAAGVAAEVPLAVYSGGVTPLRGIDTLIDALALLPEVHLALVAGPRTPYFSSLPARARNAGCLGRLHFLPYVEPHRISSFLRDATLGVHPLARYGNAEVALPNKLFDYLHAGLPVVVSDCRAMSEFVRRHGVGRVFAAGDPRSLAAAVRETLAEKEALRSPIAALCRRFCWEAGEALLLDAYRGCCDMPTRDEENPRRMMLGEGV